MILLKLCLHATLAIEVATLRSNILKNFLALLAPSQSGSFIKYPQNVYLALRGEFFTQKRNLLT